MCRSIKQLRRAERDVTKVEIQAAALQFVRKVSGYRKPSRSNAASFDLAAADIAAVTRRLLASIGAPAETNDRPIRQSPFPAREPLSQFLLPAGES